MLSKIVETMVNNPQMAKLVSSRQIELNGMNSIQHRAILDVLDNKLTKSEMNYWDS